MAEDGKGKIKGQRYKSIIVPCNQKRTFAKAIWKSTTVEASSNIYIFINIRSLNGVTMQSRMEKYPKVIYTTK